MFKIVCSLTASLLLLGLLADPVGADPPPTGACCLPDGSCELLDEETCLALDGTYQGDGTECEPNPCPPLGACCFCIGDCFQMTEQECIDHAPDAILWMEGVPCDPNPCPCCCPGTCCLPDGTCLEFVLIGDCLDLGGLFMGGFLECEPNPCLPASVGEEEVVRSTWGRVKSMYR